MEVTGYQLREAIRKWTLKRDAISGQFNESLHYFKDEEKQQPHQVVEDFLTAEKAIARLQTAQMEYNLAVMVTTKQLGEMTLAEAVKRVGGLGRVEKMWRSAVGDARRDPYDRHNALVRNKDEVRAQRTVEPKTALDRATKASSAAGNLRAVIAQGNSTKREIKNLEATLFEE